MREALATGCAIVASDVAPVREFIRDGDNGLLTSFFDPKALANKILLLLEDAGLSARLRRNARAFAEKHLDLPTYLKCYTGLIEELVEGG